MEPCSLVKYTSTTAPSLQPFNNLRISRNGKSAKKKRKVKDGKNGEKNKEQHVSIIVWMVHRDYETMRKIRRPVVLVPICNAIV